MEEPKVYKADSPQTIPLQVTRHKKLYKTSHKLKPCPDELFIEYDRLRNVRVRVNQDKSVEQMVDEEKAARRVYTELLEQVQGWGDPQGANVDDKIVRRVVEDGLFICVVERQEEEPEAGEAAEDKPWERPAEDAIILRCRFDGEELLTRHFPRAVPSADHLKRYGALKQRRKPTPGGSLSQRTVGLQSWVKPLGKLYSELFDAARAEGYEGRVPLWHQVEVVSYYLEADEASVGE